MTTLQANHKVLKFSLRFLLLFHILGNHQVFYSKWVKLKDVILRVQYGLSKAMNAEGIGFPIIRMNNLTYDGRLDLTDLKYVNVNENTAKKYLLPKVIFFLIEQIVKN